MAQDRRREQYGFEEGSWGEEDRRQRYGRYDDWQRRNDDMRRRDWRQGHHEGGHQQGGYGRGFDDYGGGRDNYGAGGEREVPAEMGRGYGQGSYGHSGGYGEGQGAYGQSSHGQSSHSQGNRYGYGSDGSSGMGSGQQYGYGADGWRGSQAGGRDWRPGGQYGGYGYSGQGYGDARESGASGSGQYGNPFGNQQYGGQQRGMWDRASDEVASWFGDDNAQSRRNMDQHRGKGPKNYARSDDRIKEDVCDNLAEHPMVDASEVDVKVSNGEVTLDGTVGSRQEKRAAEDCVERISGIKHLQNNLRVQDSQSGSMAKSGKGQTGYGATGAATGSSGTGSSPSRSGTTYGTSAGAGGSGSNERK